MQNPVHAGREQGSMRVVCWPAFDKVFDTLNSAPTQQICPAAWIAKRVRVSMSTARVYAELNNLGGRQ